MREVHPDRLLPVDPGERAIARRLYEAVRDRPVISPHGHVDPRVLLENQPFADPATLFITSDHYVTRLLHANGTDLGALRSGPGAAGRRRGAARLARAVHQLASVPSTAVQYWLEAELFEIFGSTSSPAPPAPTTSTTRWRAGSTTRTIARGPSRIRFGISVLCTTEDPCDDPGVQCGPGARPDLVRGSADRFGPIGTLNRCDPTGSAPSPRSARPLPSTPVTTGATCGAPRIYSEQLLHRPRRFHRPIKAIRTYARIHWSATRPNGSTRPGRGGQPRRGHGLRRHMLFEMAHVCRVTTGW